MAPKLYSPYGQRPRRSNQLVVLWVACFVAILVMTWYITTRHKETAKSYTSEFVMGGRVKQDAGGDAS